MKNAAGPSLRDLVSILFFFVLTGVGVGVVSGTRAVVQNAYLSNGMLEIMFWTLAKSINHHLRIFLVIAGGNVAFFSILSFLGISKRGVVSLAIVPFSIIGILFFYGRSYWHIFRVFPGRLLGKADVMIFLVVLVLLVLFLLIWYFRLRKSMRDSRAGRFAAFFTRAPALVVILSLPIGVNLLDIVDWSGPQTSSRNLILISIDTLRADHLGCYGYDKETSPHIDAFASEGIQFMKAISQSSWTLPAHAALFTGYYPSALGAVNRRRSVPPSFLMLSEILRNAGYSTAAFTGGGYLNPIFGFEQGFEAYEHYDALDSDEVWGFIDGTGERPFFLFLHTYKVHNYYVPPELMDRLSERSREYFKDPDSIMTFIDRHLVEDLDDETRPMMEHLREMYDLAIFNIDQQFGSLMSGLEARNLLEETMIVFLSDHGEEFGEHGRTYHGGTLYNEQIHVPLLVRLPDGVAGTRKIPEVVELMDIYPTILDYLELTIPEGVDGESLVPLIEGEEGFEGGMAFSEISSFVTEKYSVCDSTSKLIYAPDTENLPLAGTGRLEIFKLTWGSDWTESLAMKEGNPLIEPFQLWYTNMIRLRESDSTTDEIVLDPILQEELKALGYVR